MLTFKFYIKMRRFYFSILIVLCGSFSLKAQTCLAPQNLRATSITATSAEIAWVSSGANWDIEYGLASFTQGGTTGTLKNTGANPYTISGLMPITTYKIYVRREDCPASPSDSSSEWSDPLEFTTSCSPFSLSADLPIEEGFESARRATFQRNQDVFCSSSLGYKWSYETSVADTGRLRFGVLNFSNSGGKAATLDRSGSSETEVTNYLILTADLRNYAASTELELSFSYMHHGEDSNPNDKVWIRGSETDNWLEIYNLSANQASAGVYKHVRGLDIDVLLAQAFPIQPITPAFQVRFGQQDTGRADGLTEHSGYSFDDVAIKKEVCPFPKDLVAMNVTTNSVELSWTGGASDWDIEYGTKGFTPGIGDGIQISATISPPYTLSAVLSPITTYEVYIRDNCSSSSQSGWSDPVSFTTTCPSLSVASLPIMEDFESTSVDTVQQSQDVLCFSGYKWSYETSAADTGRLRFGVSGFSKSGNSAATLDKSIFNDNLAVNYLILTADLTNYISSTDLELSFSYLHHGEDSHSNDKVWVRGSETDTWIEVYNLNANQARAGVYKHVRGLDIDSIIGYVGHFPRQAISSTFQLRFGQQDSGVAKNLKEESGYSFDDIAIKEVACPFPTGLRATNVTANSVSLSWTTGGASKWEIEYGTEGFTPGTRAGTLVSATTNPHSLTGLDEFTAYEAYVRDSCSSSGEVSEWSNPVSFTTPCNPLSAIELPFKEEFTEAGKRTNTLSFQQDGNVFCSSGYKWNYETSTADTGRLRFGSPPGFLSTVGHRAATLDKSMSSGNAVTNFLILTIDLSDYVDSTELELDFEYLHHGEDSNPNDKVWIRASETDNWIEVYNLSANQARAGVYKRVRGLDIDALLDGVGRKVSATFQIRFGQQDTGVAISKTEGSGYSFDNIIIDQEVCPFPTTLSATNITANSAELSWTPGSASVSSWDIEYGFADSPQGTRTRISVLVNPYVLGGLVPTRTYEVYVRDNCPSSGEVSEWSDTSSFITPCSPLSAASLPIREDFESTSGTFQKNQDVLCSPEYKWSYETSASGEGRLRFSSFSNSGNVAVTLDKSMGSHVPVTNYLILTADLRNYSSSTNLELGFEYMSHSSHSNNKASVWIRGSETSAWVEAYDLVTNQGKAGVYKRVRGLDIDALLDNAGPSQVVSATFQVRFEQQDTGVAVKLTEYSGYSFDDVVIDVEDCPFPTNLEATNITANSVDLSWTPGSVSTSKWEFEYGPVGFTLGSGIQVSTTANPHTLGSLVPTRTYEVYVRDNCSSSSESEWSDPISFTTSCPALFAVALPINEDFESVSSGTFQRDQDVLCSPKGYKWSYETSVADTGRLRFGVSGFSSSGSSAVTLDKSISSGDVVTNFLILTASLRNYVSSTDLELSFSYMHHGEGSHPNDKVWIRGSETGAWVEAYNLDANLASPGVYKYVRGLDIDALLANASPSQPVSATFQVRFGQQDTGRAVSKTEESGYSFDDIAIKKESCPFPTNLEATNITANSADLSWTSGSVSTSKWELEYGPVGFTLGSGKGDTARTKTYSLKGLNQATAYEVYVRDNCSSSSTSEWSDPIRFVTPCSPLSPIAIPTASSPIVEEDFESAPVGAFQQGQDVLCSSGYKWSYETSAADTGRLRFGVSAFSKSGSSAATLDKSINSGDTIANFLILTANLDKFTASTDLELSFSYLHHGEEDSLSNDKVWVRGNETGTWAEIYDLSANRASPGVYKYVKGLDIDDLVSVTSTFQVRFGQQDTGVAISRTEHSGYSFDDVIVKEVDCPFPIDLVASGVTANSVELSWVTGGASNWNIEYGITGFTQGSGTRVSITSNPYTLRGLLYGLTYEVYVRDSCLGSASDWTGPVSFAIPCGPLPLSPSSVEAKNITASEAQLLWTIGSTLNWQVEYGIAGFTRGSGTLVHTTTNPHILTGLIAGTDYEFYIRDSCDASNKGSWVGPHAFTTLTGCQVPSSLEVDDITQTTVRVSWRRGGSPSDWDIEYDVAGFALNSGKKVSTKTNPHTLNITRLKPNTVYEVYVRDNCKALGYVSNWIGPVSFITLCAPLSTATLPIREGFESAVWDTVQQDQDVLCSAGYKWSYETSMADTGRLRFGISAFSKSGNSAATLDKSIFSGDTVANYLTLTADLSDYVDSTDLELSFNYLHHGGNSHSNDKVWIRGKHTDNWVEAYDLNKNRASTGIYKYVRSLDVDAILASRFPIQKVSSTFQVRFGQQDTGVAISRTEHSGYSFDDIAIEEVPCPFPTVSTTNITSNSVELSLTTGVTAPIWDIEYGGPGFVPGSGTRVSTAINLYVIGGLTQATAYDVYVRHDCPSSVSGFSEWSDPASFTTPCSPLSPVILPIREGFESASGTFQRGGDVLCFAGYKWSYETDAKDTSRLRFGEPGFSNSGISAATLDKSIFNSDTVTNYLILTADLTNYSPSTDLELRFSYMHHGESSHPNDKVWIRGSETGAWVEIYDLDLNRTSAGVYKHVRGLDIDALLAIAPPIQAVSSTFQVRFGRQDTGVAINRTEQSGYSFDDVAIEQIPCPFPKELKATNVTANSVELSWVTGGASIWDIEYGLVGFTPGSGSGTRISTIISSHTLGLLQENTAYDVYVRDSCSSSSVSEWSDPVSFVTPCSPLSAVTLPINEDFESASGTFQRERDVLCFAGYKWSYETTSAADTGRLRFGISGFSNSGRSAATLDKSIPSGDTITNYLILTADLTNYVSSTDLEVRFSYMHHGEDDHLNDKVWIRGSETDTWIEIYDLGLNRASAGMYKHVRGLDIDDLLNRQKVSSTFQFRFGQQDTGVAIKLGEQSGYSFDDIIIEEISCPFPTSLEVTYLVSDSVELSWATGGASKWEIEYGFAGFTLGSGTRILTTSNPNTLTSLQENTDYEAYVRDSCSSSGEVSEWSDPASFTTPCSPLSPVALPLEEDFESLLGTFQQNREVFCSSGYKWNYETSAADTGRLRFRVPAFPNSGISAATLDKSISNSDTVANYLILTADLSTYASSADLELKFSYMHHEKDSSLSNNNKVWIRGSEAGAWVEIYDLSVNQANPGVYKHVRGLDIDALLAGVRPSQAVSSTFQLRFVQQDTGVAIRLREESGYSLDDIVIEEISCPFPTGLSATNITAMSVDLSWTTGGAKNWDVEYGVAGFTLGTGTRINNPANPHILSGLTPSTDYEFYVRDSCGAGDFSVWEGPHTFRTLSCLAPSSLRASGTTLTIATLSWTTGGTNNWDVEYGAAGFTLGTGTRISTLANPYAVSGLTSGQSYEFYVRDSCGVGDVSVWKGPHAFSVLSCQVPSSLRASNTAPTITALSWTTGGANSWELEYGVAGFALSSGTRIGVTTNPYAVSGLTSGQSYEFYVRDSCGVGDVSRWAGPQAFRTLSCPDPSSLSAGGITQTTATLSWVIGGASEWELEYGIAGFARGTGTRINNPANPYILSGLTPGTDYEFYVWDSCGVGNVSKWAGPQAFRTLSCPDPSSLSAGGITQTTATLSWMTGGGASEWELEYGLAGFVPDSGTRINNPANPYILSGLTPGTDYEFYVWDSCGVGNVSKWVGPQAFRTLICPDPSSLSAGGITQTTATLSWMTGGASEWELEYGLAGFVPDSGTRISTTANPYILSGLTPGADYEFYVRDSCGINNVSKWVGPQAFRTLICPDPSSLMPIGITPTTVTLSWITGGAKNWDLEYGVAGFSLGTGTRISTTLSSYGVSGLAYGQSYDFYVRDSCDVGNVSKWVGPQTITLNCPAPSSLMMSGITQTTVTLSWITGGANNWDLEYGSPGFIPGTGTQISTIFNSYVVNGLTHGQLYDFYVRDSCDVGNVSKWVGPQTITLNCPAPSSLIVGGITQTTVDLSWITGGANNWELEYGSPGFVPGTGTRTSTPTNPYILSGLTHGQSYDLYVRDSCDVGNVSKWVGPQTITLNCPDPSSLMADSITQTTVDLSWVTGGASEWELEYGVAGFVPDSGTRISTPTNPYILSGLTPGTDYDFYVRDSCDVGNVSKWVGPQAFRTLICPDPSFLIAGSITQTTVDLSWMTGGSNNWDLEYGSPGFTLGTGTRISTPTNPYILSGLTPRTDYELYVRDSCGVDNVSKWVGPQAFRTLICPVPSSLMAGGITQTTVTLSWVTGGSNNWDLEYGSPGFIPGMGTQISTTLNSYVVNGLTHGRSYDFYVRDSCDVGNVSKWVGPQTVTLNCPAPSSLMTGGITQTTVTLSWTTGGSNNWDLEYGSPGFIPGMGTQVSTTLNSYGVSGLTHGQSYDFYVRDSCDVGNVSKWVGPQTITLICPAPSSLIASSITQTTAILSWTTNGVNNWDLEYGIKGFSLGTGTQVSTTLNSYGVSGLAHGQSYEFYVRDSCDVGNVSKWIGPESFTTLICPVPSSLMASHITQTIAILSWTTGGANNWDLEYGLAGFAPGTGTRINTTLNSYGVSGLVPGTDYDFYVRDSCGVSNVSRWEGPETFVTLSCPAPSSLSASNITQNTVILSWVTGGANNWDLEYGIKGFSLGMGTRISATANPYGVSGLVPGTDYDFYVRDSCGVSNVSRWEGPETFRTLSCPAPSSLSASYITPTIATLSWITGGANNWDLEYGIRGFSLGTGTRISITANPYFVSGLVPSQSYDFYVRDSCGVGDVSRWEGPEAFGCSVPSSLSASNITQTTTTLSWVTGGANNWDLEYGIKSFSLGMGTRISTTANPYGVSGLVTNTDYEFYVRDSCGAGNVSKWIGPQSFRTLNCPAPSSLIASSITQTTTTLSWVTGGANNWDLEYGIRGFSLGTGTRINTALNSYGVSGLMTNTDYEFYVRDSCGAGNVSKWIGPQSFATLSCPAPSSLSASNITQTTTTLSWVTGGANNWDLEYGIRGFSFGTGTRINTALNSYGVSGLMTNTDYEFYVRDSCGAGNVSKWIGPQSFATLSCPAPSSLSASNITQTTTTLSWVTGGANNWDLEYGIRGFSFGTGARINTTLNSYGVSGLMTNTDYEFYVRDSCGAGNVSKWIGPQSFATLSCPAPSSLSASNITQTTATLSWVTGGANNWDLEYGIRGFSFGTGTRINTTLNSYGVSGLMTNTDYEFYVRDSCGAGNVSKWIGPQSFRTLSCPAPSSLSASNITQTTATLSWVTGGANNWDLEYGIRGFSFGTGTRINTTLNSYGVSGLMTNTDYEFYVRDNCGAGNVSKWIGPQSFRTLICPAPSSLSASNITQTTTTLSWVTGGANNWDLEYGIRGFSLGTRTRINTTLNSYGVSGLMTNTAYEFYVRDSCGAGNVSKWIGPQSFRTLSCPAPSSLSASNITQTTATLSWVTGGANNWDLEYGIRGFSFGTGTRINTTLNSYGVSSLVTNTAYEFYVRDSCGAGNVSKWIGPQFFATLSCPAPSSLSASNITQTTATLSWVAGLGANNWDLEYGIRGFSLGTGTRISTTTNSYGMSGLMTNTAYDFYVRDSCVGSVSRWVGPYAFATLICPAPSSLSASNITQTTATLSWIAGVGAISWDLEYGIRGFSPGTGTFINVSTNSYGVSSLISNTAYDFYVRNNCGVGNVSGWIGPETFKTARCPAPSSLMAGSITQTTATLSWITGGANNWDLEYGSPGFVPGTGTGTRVSTTVNPYAVSSLTPGTAYDFYVRDSCAVGDASNWVGPHAFGTLSCPAPSSLMAGGITQTTATLSWITGGANNWDLEYGSPGFVPGTGTGTRVSTTVNPYAVSSLTPGTAYDFYVRDSCAVGDASNWVGPHAFGTLSCPAPSSLMAGGITQTTATLSWITGGANNWDLEYGSPGFVPGTGTRISTTTNSYSVSGLVINTAYEFYVRDSCGVDNLSNWVGPHAFGTLSCPAPSSLMAGGITHTTATLSWVTGGANNWDLEYGIRGFSLGTGTRVSTTVNPYAVSSLTPNTAYDFYVRDSCGVNNLSVWTGPEDFATLGCPAPSSLRYVADTITSSAEISWNSGGASNWNLEYGPPGFTPGTGTFLYNVLNPQILGGLSKGDDYDVYVQDSCAAGDISSWSGPLEIRSFQVDELLERSLRIYPNPSDGIFNVEFNSTFDKDIRIQVINMLGQLILEDELENFSRKSLDMGAHSRGVYILKLITEGEVVNRRITLQ